MVKPVAKAEISSFIKGFITEASPLNFPADASRDEENFELNSDGSRDRRLGIDFETDYTLRSTGYTATNIESVATTSYKWLSAGNDANNEFVVVQFGDHIDVYDSANDTISTDGYVGTVTLTGVDATKRFSYGSVDGKLVIAAGTENIHLVEYVGTSLVYSTTRILVRDLWGLPGNEGNDVTIRPTIQTDEHIYNLRNQGWGVPRKNSAGTLSDPVSVFYSSYSAFPSNAETVYTALQFQPVTAGTPFERLYPDLFNDSLGLDAASAKGYFIIDLLRRGSSRLTENGDNQDKYPSLVYPLTDLAADITSGGAAVVEDFAGRMFYAGFGGAVTDGDSNSPILSSFVCFSQVVKKSDDIVKCYQHGDPTSRESSDLVDTDGGFIRISGAKKILGLAGLSSDLFVIADNGIWKISGGSDYGFTATNYAVSKISSYGCNNTASIVVVNDQIFFWGQEGIFSVVKNQYGDWIVSNISAASVQTYFDAIEVDDREKATGFYDPFDKKVRWVFNTDFDRDNLNTVYELILDVQLGAFSKTHIYNLATNTPEVVGIISSASFVAGLSPTNVVVDTEAVVVNGESVQTLISTRTAGIQSMKYVTLYSTVGGNVGYTFSQYKDVTFKDWKTADGVGVDAFAFILTGVVTAKDSSVFKQTPYLVTHFLKTETGVETVGGELVPAKQSSCFIRSQWDWANSIVSNKWSSLFQAYRYRKPLFILDADDEYDNGFEVVTSKNKLRGRGRALSLYFSTEAGKDCRILGWNLSITGNSLA